MVDQKRSEQDLAAAIDGLTEAVRELRTMTAEENLELRGRVRRLEAALEQRLRQDAIDRQTAPTMAQTPKATSRPKKPVKRTGAKAKARP